VKKITIRYIQPVKAITAKFLVWENTTRRKLHPLELTRKVATDFAFKGTSRRLHKGRYWRIEVISELKCMYSRRYHRDRTKCNVIGELTLPTKRYKRIQLYSTDLQEVSGPIRNKLKSYFQGKFFPPPQ